MRRASAGTGQAQSPIMPTKQQTVPEACWLACARNSIRPTPLMLCVWVATQRMGLFVRRGRAPAGRRFPSYELAEEYSISTSRFGIGQKMHSNKTPLGLHRIARKVGGDQPVGTIFKSRVPVGRVGEGAGEAGIVHRILWLAGLEPGFNQGGQVDTFQRYIYLHGYGDETTLGRPQSLGCIHVGVADLIPLYRRVPRGTLVYISRTGVHAG